MTEEKTDAAAIDEELDRQLLATQEQLDAEIWTANTREALNMAQSVYLVTDETDVLTMNRNAAAALVFKPEHSALLLDIIRSGVIAERLFIPKAAKDKTPESIKKRLDASLEAENLPMKVYICPLLDGMNTVTEYEQKKPGAFPAWIRENEAVIDREREQYEQETTGAGRLDALTKYIEDSARRPVISTGFHTLDMALGDGKEAGGLTAGLYTIGAISSLGKTTFAMQIADNIAASDKKDVLIVALEMSVFELMAKSISRLTTETMTKPSDQKTVQGILQGARYPRYSETERQTIDQAKAIYKEMAKRLYFMEGIGDIGVREVRRAIKRHIELRGEAPIVIVDYLQILAPADPRATDKMNIDKAVIELKRISRDFSIPVIAISSFNRGAYVGKVTMSAFKESGAIEYTSDAVIGLEPVGLEDGESDNTKKENGRKIAECKAAEVRNLEAVILKNRSGRTGQTVRLDYIPRFNKFEEPNGGHKYSASDIPQEAKKGVSFKELAAQAIQKNAKGKK